MSATSPRSEYAVAGAVIRILAGDITGLACDAIVNAANDRLWMGGGVAGAIKRRGGVEIEREAVRQGPVSIGEAVATRAGRLPARYVIHAVTMGQDLATGEWAIRAATRSALRLADRLGLESVALPALGTGVGGFPLDQAATAMLGEAVAHLRGGSRLREVVLALYDEPAHAAFVQALDRLARGGGTARPA
ncbi:MAG TPA: macro domain-containing protein [bacterium]|nr:macro domain-containing protein [bacterium]